MAILLFADGEASDLTICLAGASAQAMAFCGD